MGIPFKERLSGSGILLSVAVRLLGFIPVLLLFLTNFCLHISINMANVVNK